MSICMRAVKNLNYSVTHKKSQAFRIAAINANLDKRAHENETFHMQARK